MTGLLILSFLGGILTVLSPCILPVLPFVFARADRPFLTTGAPLLGGMAVTFAVVASLAAVDGGWAVHANQYGRIAALCILAVFGLTLLLPSLMASLARPLVALGARLSSPGTSSSPGVGTSFGLGIATGLLWAPCAGPILGLVLTGAALRGASASTTLLLFAYALGAATSLAASLLVGGRVLASMKRLLGPTEWLRRVVGGAIIVATAAIALGFDTGFLTRVSLASTSGLEEGLINRVGARGNSGVLAADSLIGRPSPSLAGAAAWLNSPPLTIEGLRGKVVLVDFWTYSCINCLRALPYVRAWDEKYGSFGVAVVSIHSPEFAFERDVDNVRRAVQNLGVAYPVAVDDSLTIWRGFDNHYWPADYLIDADGRVRAYHFGEGHYAESEATIRRLLSEAGYRDIPRGFVQPLASGAEAPADEHAMESSEAYVGYARERDLRAGPFGGTRHLRMRRPTPSPAIVGARRYLDGGGAAGGSHRRLRPAGLPVSRKGPAYGSRARFFEASGTVSGDD